jgi:hypothetical protein
MNRGQKTAALTLGYGAPRRSEAFNRDSSG